MEQTEQTLEQRINDLFAQAQLIRSDETLGLLAEFRKALNAGAIRVAEPHDGEWKLNAWVKKGLLLHLALGELREAVAAGGWRMLELDTMPDRQFTRADRVRIPGHATYVRDGAYLGPDVTCIPPVFINMGAHVGARCTLDSHVSVGLCAQVGEGVLISAGTQIGGHLNPIDNLPTVVCDGAIIGGNCGIYDGVYVGPEAIIAAGTILTGKMRIYDARSRRYLVAEPNRAVCIPEKAIVVPGTHPIDRPSGAGVSVHMPVIVGSRDDPKLENDALAGLLD